ncbi:MAG: SGNH/GDSL hydrolase family protein [Burkholderiales bacterium]
MKQIRAALSLLLTLCLSTAAFAKPFSAIWIFGGPLEDVGNYASVFGDLPPPFYNNRFSNGPLAVETLAAQLGFTATPSLHRIGPVRGNDFASADAFASGPEPKDLRGQLDAYFAANDDVADPDALYYMIIGGNEIIQATFEPDDAKAHEILRNAVEAKKSAIHRLVGAGATTMFVDNFFDLGVTPQFLSAGLSERATKMAKIHNRLMKKMLDRVERQLRFRLIRFDVFQFTHDALGGADALRFTNTTDSCLALLPIGQCDFDHFLFFNELFPSARTHQLWGNALVGALMRNGYCQKHPRGRVCREHD